MTIPASQALCVKSQQIHTEEETKVREVWDGAQPGSISRGAGIQTQILLSPEPEILTTMSYLPCEVSKVSSRMTHTVIRMWLLFQIITYFLSEIGADSFPNSFLLNP